MKEAATLYRYETASYYRALIIGLQYIRHGISGYQTLLSKNIVLKIPAQNGFKLFLVSHGMIRLKENALTPKCKIDINEKSYIDFRDILYSGFMSLAEDMVIILDKQTLNLHIIRKLYF